VKTILTIKPRWHFYYPQRKSEKVLFSVERVCLKPLLFNTARRVCVARSMLSQDVSVRLSVTRRYCVFYVLVFWRLQIEAGRTTTLRCLSTLPNL